MAGIIRAGVEADSWWESHRAVVLNLRWWRQSQHTECTPNTPSELICCEQCLLGLAHQREKKNWPSWHGATSKHHRLPPVTSGRTAQLAASLTYELSGGNQNKGEEREFPNVALSQLMSAFHWHFLITHMLWILTVICFYWLTDEKHAKKKEMFSSICSTSLLDHRVQMWILIVTFFFF